MKKSIPKYRDQKNVGIPTRLGKTHQAQNPRKGLRNLGGEQEGDSRHPQPSITLFSFRARMWEVFPSPIRRLPNEVMQVTAGYQSSSDLT
jgi:hypothetical protein